MRASDLLGDLDTPGLRVRLLPVVPEQVVVRACPPWMAGFWPRWVAAMTMPWAVYVRPAELDGEPERLARLIAHELIHVRQWKTLGPTGFLRRYVTDYLRGRFRHLGHRDAYRAVGLEAEAYDTTERL